MVEAKRPSRVPQPVRITLLVVLVGLILSWLFLQAENSSAATPVLLVGFVFSAVCAFLAAIGRL